MKSLDEEIRDFIAILLEHYNVLSRRDPDRYIKTLKEMKKTREQLDKLLRTYERDNMKTQRKSRINKQYISLWKEFSESLR